MYLSKRKSRRGNHITNEVVPEGELQDKEPASGEEDGMSASHTPFENKVPDDTVNYLVKKRMSLNIPTSSLSDTSISSSFQPSSNVRRPSMRRRSIAEGIRAFVESEHASREKHRELYRIEKNKVDRRNKILLHIDALEIARLRAKQSKAQFKSTINTAERAQNTLKRIGAISLSAGTSTAAGIGGSVAGGFVGSLAFPGVGTVVGGVLGGYLAGKVTSTMIEYVTEKSGSVTSVNAKTSKLFKAFKEAEEKLDSYAGYVAKKFKDMDPRNSHGQQKMAKEVSKFALGKIPLVGPVAKTLPEFVELGHEVRRAHEGFEQNKWEVLIEGTQSLIDALKQSLTEITRQNNEERGGEDILIKNSFSGRPGTKLDFDIRLSKITADTANVIAKLESNLEYFEKNKPELLS
ncbi:TPA: hypothetical protein SLG40_003831 [Serratia odorifera]|nr:hypothetical protein [Serratia odorifera]